jgi:DNA-directed RNA polymerase subunit RPC12/RpoP
MAKEKLGYVQLEWTCPNCGSRNPGPEKICGSCGAPQPDNVKFEQTAEEKLIADERLLKQAKAVPDIHCAYCGTRNPAGTETCSQCGGDLREGVARTGGEVLGAHRRQAAPDVTCEACGTANRATALRCAQCGAVLPRPQAAPKAAAVPARKGVSPVVYAVIGLVVLACIAFAALALRTQEVVGRVTGVSWERSIAIEAFVPVERDDWWDEIPEGAVLGRCTERVRHVQDEPAANAERVCGTPYTVDQGSGFGEVVQDCEYQVYEDWCEYTVDEWQAVDEIVVEGTDFSPIWPQLTLSQDQRAGEEAEEYQCIFDSDGERYVYNTDDVAEFAQCTVGSRWILEVNSFGAVVGIAPDR